MLPSLRYATLKELLASAMAVPRQAFSGLWYRLHGLKEPMPRRHVPVLESITSEDEGFKRIAFTFSVIALSARIAGLDGSLSKEKYVAFREVFPLSGEICGKIRSLFALAYENPTSFEHYVTQIKYAFPGQMPLFESVVDRLFRIASADGKLSREAEFMLAKVARMLDISPGGYSRIRDRHVTGGPADHLWEPKHRQQADQLKGRYRELMRRYHPDKFAAQNVSPEVELLLQLKTSEINETYRRLSKKAA
jgi:DnaJ like chaperone protein